MPSGGGGGANVTPVQTTQKTTSAPWKAQQPYLKTGFEQAESEILNQPTSYFPGQTYANFTPQQEQALGLQEQRALAGSPLLQGAQQHTLDTLSGNYLQNPNQNALINSIGAAVNPAVSGQFAAAGRGGGSAGESAAIASEISRAFAPYAFNDYRAGRNEMMSAAAGAPGLAQQDYFDIGQLMGVGSAYQSQDQAQIAEDMSRYNYGQMEPYQRLAAYMGLIGGNYGGTSTQQGTALVPTTAGANPLLQGLGGASSLASIAGNLYPIFSGA